MKNNSWKTLSTKIVYENKWMKVREDSILLPNGKKGIYGVVEKIPFALIIPIIGNKIALVEQFRYPVQTLSLEFPQGFKEGMSESIEKTAIDELKEETGLKAQSMEKIGELWLAPGHHTQTYTIFVARNCKKGSKNLEDSEVGMKTKFFTLEEIKEMVKKGVIKDSPTVSALSLYLVTTKS